MKTVLSPRDWLLLPALLGEGWEAVSMVTGKQTTICTLCYDLHGEMRRGYSKDKLFEAPLCAAHHYRRDHGLDMEEAIGHRNYGLCDDIECVAEARKLGLCETHYKRSLRARRREDV